MTSLMTPCRSPRADGPVVPDTMVVMVEVFDSQGCDSDYAMGF